jgi:hypothetical protein
MITDVNHEGHGAHGERYSKCQMPLSGICISRNVFVSFVSSVVSVRDPWLTSVDRKPAEMDVADAADVIDL